jgi:putative FmdB family regulatory protein
MPIYEYRCEKCGSVFEKLQSSFVHKEFCEEVSADCLEHGKLVRLMSGFSAGTGGKNTSNASSVSSSSHVHSSGCGCGNPSPSCMGNEIRKKYGID